MPLILVANDPVVGDGGICSGVDNFNAFFPIVGIAGGCIPVIIPNQAVGNGVVSSRSKIKVIA